jgi:hypothetical protein
MEYTLAFCTLRYSEYNLRNCALHVNTTFALLSPKHTVITS